MADKEKTIEKTFNNPDEIPELINTITNTTTFNPFSFYIII